MKKRRASPRTPEPERFFSFVKKTSSCWIWIGGRGGGRKKSYGYFRVGYQSEGNRRQVYAHRWSWIHHKGDIPSGLQINHKCDNQLCVNPDHLYIGTQQENVKDAIDRGLNARGETLSKLTVNEVRFVRRLIRDEFSDREIAVRVGKVTPGAIYQIRKGNSWRWLS